MTLVLHPLQQRYSTLVPGAVVPGAPLVPGGDGPVLTAREEVNYHVVVYPAAYPSLGTFPSLATFPAGRDPVTFPGPRLTARGEGALSLIPLGEV